MLTGCSADDDGALEVTTDEAGEDLAVLGREPTPIGTFRSDEVRIGQLMLLVLKDDGTFHSGIAAACAFPVESCTPVRDGYYHVSQRSPGNAGLYLYNADGDPIDQYQYHLAGDTLHLRRLSSMEWYTMDRSASAWCGEASDCEVQGLGTAACIGEWMCSTNQCRYSCYSKSE